MCFSVRRSGWKPLSEFIVFRRPVSAAKPKQREPKQNMSGETVVFICHRATRADETELGGLHTSQRYWIFGWAHRDLWPPRGDPSSITWDPGGVPHEQRLIISVVAKPHATFVRTNGGKQRVCSNITAAFPPARRLTNDEPPDAPDALLFYCVNERKSSASGFYCGGKGPAETCRRGRISSADWSR